MSPMPRLVRELLVSSIDERRRQRDGLNAFREALRRELDRSRRYERRFALLAASLTGPLDRQQRARLIAAMRSSLRSSDAFCVAERRLYVLLPEVDAEATERAFDRIRELEPTAVDELSVAIATFPDDGVTMGSMLALLRRVDVARRRRMSRIDGALGAAIGPGAKRDERAG